MKTFTSLRSTPPVERQNDHAGNGPILFRRVLDSAEFRSGLDFVDYTHIPPGSSIGKHEHHGNEEVYFITEGQPLMRVNGEESRLEKGSFAIVRDGEWHELVNDSASGVEILVFQVSLG